MKRKSDADPRTVGRSVAWQQCRLEEASAEALRRIEAAQAESRAWLDLGDLPLAAIPREIERLGSYLRSLALGLEKIDASGRRGEIRQIQHPLSDLGPLAGLKNLT